MARYVLHHHGADVNVRTAVSEPCMHKQLTMILIDRQHMQYGGTPIMIAAANGHEEMVQYLAEQGADVNARGGHVRLPCSYLECMTSAFTISLTWCYSTDLLLQLCAHADAAGQDRTHGSCGGRAQSRGRGSRPAWGRR
jgi:ankyrin repeat protein